MLITLTPVVCRRLLKQFINNQEVILIGNEFNKCQHNFIHFFNSVDALGWIEENPIEDMFILLKGSRGIKLEILKKVL